jgi:hypothetical protein
VLSGRSWEATLAGEAKWARSVDGVRAVHDLERKAEQLPRRREPLAYAVCARNEIVNVPPGTVTVTAEDIFAA